MSAPEAEQHLAREAEQPLLERLLAGGEGESAAAAVERFGLWRRPAAGGARPHVMLNMVSTIDGRGSLRGRSGPLSDPADRALFHALRATADAILVGAGTVRTERYGRLIRDAATRRLRLERGLREEPLACIVSGHMSLEEDVPLLAEPAAEVVILTAEQASLSAPAAKVDYVRSERAGELDLVGALAQLRERFGVETVLCEGGPHLARSLFALGLVDELFLSIAPLLAAGEPSQLRILAGPELEPPLGLELRDALRHRSTLFLRYAVFSGARVARETTLSSSLAS